jgi:dTDP-4-dehydrorhamnose reductase
LIHEFVLDFEGVTFMKALVLGGEGMLGHKMYQTLLERFPDTGCTILGSTDASPLTKISLLKQGTVIQQQNVMDFDNVSSVIRKMEPEFLINCIGIVKQRAQAEVAIPSISINSLLPHRLADLATKWNGRVIHFSTDCIFSGKRGNYTEADQSDATDLYGKTKYLGEVVTANAVTLRTSIIGRELAEFTSLLEWFLAQEGKTINGYRKVIYSGVTTNYLAEVVGKIIAEKPTLSGLYQVTSTPISKYDLLTQLKQTYGLNVTINEDRETISNRSMISDKFVQATGYVCPSWPELIRQLANDPTPYADWR